MTELDLDALEEYAKRGVEFGDGSKIVDVTEDTLLALIRLARISEKAINNARRLSGEYEREAKDAEAQLTEFGDHEAMLLRGFARTLRKLGSDG